MSDAPHPMPPSSAAAIATGRAAATPADAAESLRPPSLVALAALFARYANLVVAAVPLAKDALTTPLTVALAALCLPLLLSRRVDTLWIIAGSAAITLGESLIALAATR